MFTYANIAITAAALLVVAYGAWEWRTRWRPAVGTVDADEAAQLLTGVAATM